uniref:F-box domain-containing protein n=1 Tax=Ditylenchus dipsaci TaxID=166011 RepID=A0A915CQ83_9BILA
MVSSDIIVSVLEFLSRNELDLMRLISSVLNSLISNYLPNSPYRLFDIISVGQDEFTGEIVLNASSRKSKHVEVVLEDSQTLHLFIKNCCIKRLEFRNFEFTDLFVSNVLAMHPDNFVINDVSINFFYQNKWIEEDLISNAHLQELFSTKPFRCCQSAILLFDERIQDVCQSRLETILQLKVHSIHCKTNYSFQPETLELVADWLHDSLENPPLKKKSLWIDSDDLSPIQTFYMDFIFDLKQRFEQDEEKRPYEFYHTFFSTPPRIRQYERNQYTGETFYAYLDCEKTDKKRCCITRS